MKEFTIDLALFKTKKQAHEVIKTSLFYYEGANLDALHDALTSILEDVLIRLENVSRAEEKLEGYSDRIVEVFSDSAKENDHLRIIVDD